MEEAQAVAGGDPAPDDAANGNSSQMRVVVQGRGLELEGRIKAELEKKPPFSVRDLAVTGHDVMDHLKIPAGPAVGTVLNHLLEQVLDDPALNEKSALLKLAKDYYTGLETK